MEKDDSLITVSNLPKDAVFEIVPMKEFIGATGKIREYCYLKVKYQTIRKGWFGLIEQVDVDGYVAYGRNKLELESVQVAKEWIANFKKFHGV